MSIIHFNSERERIDIHFTTFDNAYNSYIDTGEECIQITSEQFKKIRDNQDVFINGKNIKPYSSGGSNIRKTIKKKYRKSKFITQKNRKNIKKKIILKKSRTLKRKYKRIL